MILSRPLLIGLIASATLNVFLVGGVAGVLLARRPPAPVAPPPAPVVASPPALVEPPAPPQAAPAARPPAPPPPAPRNPPAEGERAPLWSAGQGLSPESRQALRQALREANQRNRPISRQAKTERQAALVAMRSGNYDPADVARRLAAARALDIQARGNVETALANYAARLSPDERQALAEGLARVYGPRARVQPGR